MIYMAPFGFVFISLLVVQTPEAFTEKNLAASCGTCHPLDPVRAARLSRAGWGREVEKMEAMGAKVKNRKLLLDYLAATYGLRREVNPATRVR